MIKLSALQLARGAYRSNERNAAIDSLIKIASSPDFKTSRVGGVIPGPSPAHLFLLNEVSSCVLARFSNAGCVITPCVVFSFLSSSCVLSLSEGTDIDIHPEQLAKQAIQVAHLSPASRLYHPRPALSCAVQINGLLHCACTIAPKLQRLCTARSIIRGTKYFPAGKRRSGPQGHHHPGLGPPEPTHSAA